VTGNALTSDTTALGFTVDIFEHRLATQTSIANIARCFPLQPLAVEAPFDVFDRFYRVAQA
jgi:hypothetical protein